MVSSAMAANCLITVAAKHCGIGSFDFIGLLSSSQLGWGASNSQSNLALVPCSTHSKARLAWKKESFLLSGQSQTSRSFPSSFAFAEPGSCHRSRRPTHSTSCHHSFAPTSSDSLCRRPHSDQECSLANSLSSSVASRSSLDRSSPPSHTASDIENMSFQTTLYPLQDPPWPNLR